LLLDELDKEDDEESFDELDDFAFGGVNARVLGDKDLDDEADDDEDDDDDGID
jgi:hypothetical protein